MKQKLLITVAALFTALFSAHAQEQKPQIVHDAEYYILDAQHGEKWAVEDKDSTRSWLS
jgi:arylsulfatase